MNASRARHLRVPIAAGICLCGLLFAWPAGAQEIAFRCDPSQTAAAFTLGDVLHTVRGSFQAKQCEILFDPASGRIGGGIVIDATSGQSGNAARDRKMHSEVLESTRYPEISFKPDYAEGKLTVPGASTIKVHGVFGIHGAEHEMIVPVAVTIAADHWAAFAQFEVPYVAWGLRNPSVLLLRVGNIVHIDFHAEGSLPSATP